MAQTCAFQVLGVRISVSVFGARVRVRVEDFGFRVYRFLDSGVGDICSRSRVNDMRGQRSTEYARIRASVFGCYP